MNAHISRFVLRSAFPEGVDHVGVITVHLDCFVMSMSLGQSHNDKLYCDQHRLLPPTRCLSQIVPNLLINATQPIDL